jgi:hypothetical protein
VGPVGGTLYIFANRARASHRWRPLSSNVRPHKMPQWIFEVLTSEPELEELRQWFTTGPAYLMLEGTRTFLTGPRFAAVEDGLQAHQLARNTIADMATIAEICMGQMNLPMITGAFEVRGDGTRRPHYFGELPNMIRFPRVAHDPISSGDQTYPERLIKATRASIHLTVAARLWSRARDGKPIRSWPRLYRIMEELEKHLGTKLHEATICTEVDRLRFTRSANTAEVSGEDSRHCIGNYRPPKDPMSHAEAEFFIGACLRDVILLQSSQAASSVA